MACLYKTLPFIFRRNQFKKSRTIYRDIDAINLAGIPVSSIPGMMRGNERTTPL